MHTKHNCMMHTTHPTIAQDVLTREPRYCIYTEIKYYDLRTVVICLQQKAGDTTTFAILRVVVMYTQRKF